MQDSAAPRDRMGARGAADRDGAAASLTKTRPEEQLTGVESLPPAGHALLSALVPGLGQLAQGRRLTAAAQFGTVATYLVSAYAVGGGRALWLAALWNAWSAVEAYWRAPR